MSDSPGSYQHNFQAVHLNSDDNIDVIAQQWDFNFINIFINSGDRVNDWDYIRILSTTNVMPPVVMDLDGTFGSDVITCDRYSRTWRILRSNHASNAQYSTVVTEGFTHVSASSGVESSGALDFDSDGRMDIVIADRSKHIAVYRNVYHEGSRYFSSSAVQTQTVSFDIGFIDIGDINNDGIDDIVFGGYGTGHIICNGDGTWQSAVTLASPSSVHPYGGVKIFDIDGYVSLLSSSFLFLLVQGTFIFVHVYLLGGFINGFHFVCQ